MNDRRRPLRKQRTTGIHRGWVPGPGFFDAARVHEIRNHLTALSVSAQMFPGKKTDPKFLENFEKLLVRETDRLLELTGRFIEKVKADLEPKTLVEWEILAERVLELMKPVFQERGTDLRVEKSQTLKILGAACQLESLILNLVRNALESAGSGGRVKVSTRREGSSLVFEVWNDGKPIPRELLEEIFKPFFTTKKDGTGLGLAICQWVVENHGGRIEVHSTVSGTLFRVCLPLGTEKRKRRE